MKCDYLQMQELLYKNPEDYIFEMTELIHKVREIIGYKTNM